MSGLGDAVRYLTIVPFPGASGSHQALGRAAPWFPVVGLGIGAALVVGEWVTVRLFGPLLGALIIVTVWKLASGGLHLDGLADCLDGLMGRDAAHRLLIMRDSRIGAFGAIGLILFLMLEIAAVAELSSAARGATLAVAPAVARAMPPLLSRLFRAARPDGQGATFGAAIGPMAVPIALAVALVAAAVGLGWLGLVGVVIASIVAIAFGRFMTARIGGITGDVHGAAVELSELAMLLTVSAWLHVRP
ncbi:MAG: adenosylcobinamide-GDP ribazoletransferase [Candidatus Rokubacteria bacterium]|nr:adenosylcobinamide-GDP ribazoletransferase [Candidatus Rokubacteria bacterium]